MRKWMATLLFLVLVFGFACAWAETAIDKVDLTGDWKMDYLASRCSSSSTRMARSRR